MRFFWIAALAAVVVLAVVRSQKTASTTPRIAERTEPTATSQSPHQISQEVSNPPRTAPSQPELKPVYPNDIKQALERSRERAEKLYARFPGTKEKLLARHRIDAALRLGEFLSHAGIVGETRDRLLDLLAEEMEAPNRGELGEREVMEMRQLIGDEKFEQLRAYEKIAPGLHRADEIVARLRDAQVELGESEAGIRELAANTASATEQIRRRIYQGTPIDPTEERQLTEQARARFQTLRNALSATGDERALQALDAWIAQKINADLKFAKEAIAWHAKSRP